MQIEDQFRVSVPVEEAWRVLLDIERIAPCLPGAQLQEIEGDEFRGIVKVKVGPITAQYKGTARLEEVDDGGHTALIAATGRDTRGAGNASAAIRVVLVPDGDGTRVSIDTDLSVTGKVAQFGRGVLADVSAKLLAQFVTNLERDVLAAGTAAASAVDVVAEEAREQGDAPAAAPADRTAGNGAGPAGVTTIRTIDAPEPEPVDLLAVSGGSVGKRLVPIVVALVAVALLLGLRGRRRRRHGRVRGSGGGES